MCENDGSERVLDRRTVLTTGAVALGAGLAGCTATDDSTGTETTDAETTEETDTGTGTTGQTDTETATTEPVALDEPVEPTESDSCAVCNMKPANFPEWNGQMTLAMDDGHRAYTCSPGCLVTLAAKPGNFVDGATAEDVRSVWAHDRTTTDLIDATTANWVLDPDDERAGGPMSGNPLPFAELADAEGYVEQYDDLTTDDVVRLTEFTTELGKQYRGKHY
jgi:nitrous oxide reductase accessory protein NosL